MSILARILTARRRQRLSAAVRNLDRIERHAAEAAAGQRAQIIDLQQRIGRDERALSAGDIAHRAARAMKRSLLA
jgi:hypothetical protein